MYLTLFPSVQTPSQSSSSQSLSATATSFFCLILLLFHQNFKHYLNQTSLPQVFSSPLKTTSDHISSTELIKVITSPTSLSSSSETPRTSVFLFHFYLCSISMYSYFHLLLHPQLIPHFPHLYLHLAITLYLILHQKLNILKNKNKEEFFDGQYILHFWADWKKSITETIIPGCSIKSSFKQVWVIIQVYPFTVGCDLKVH